MVTQTDLFEPPETFTRSGSSIVPPQPAEFARARSRDPETSKASAKAVDEFASRIYAKIVHALSMGGPMTVAELAKYTGLDEQQCNKRLPELAANNKRGNPVAVAVVKDSEGHDVTRPGPSGRQQRVWRAV